jgi:hypothetical protein
MFKWLFKWFKVPEVPEDKIYCESCRATSCTEEHYRTCPRRLNLVEQHDRNKREMASEKEVYWEAIAEHPPCSIVHVGWVTASNKEEAYEKALAKYGERREACQHEDNCLEVRKRERFQYIRSLEEAIEFVKEVGYPILLHPSFSFRDKHNDNWARAKDEDTLRIEVSSALDKSPTRGVLLIDCGDD